MSGEYKTCVSDGKATVLSCRAGYAADYHEMDVRFSGNVSGANMDGKEIVGAEWQCKRNESGLSCNVLRASYQLK
jgi:hypothetical protein